MLHVVTTLLLFAVAASSSVCAHLTRPDRNYYPMQRVLWTVLGFVYGGAGLAALVNGATPPLVRVAFSAAVLAGTTYSIVFMRRRNKIPRFVPIDALGQPQIVEQDALRDKHLQTVSYMRHGAMPAEWVAELDEARLRWQELEDWRGRVRGETDARIGRKGE